MNSATARIRGLPGARPAFPSSGPLDRLLKSAACRWQPRPRQRLRPATGRRGSRRAPGGRRGRWPGRAGPERGAGRRRCGTAAAPRSRPASTAAISRFWICTWIAWIDPGREQAAGADGVELVRRRGAAREGRAEQVGRRDRVLDGEVDADAADRRHGVGGVADAEQAGPVPRARAGRRHGSSFTSSQSRSSPTRSAQERARRRRPRRGTRRCRAARPRRCRPWG